MLALYTICVLCVGVFCGLALSATWLLNYIVKEIKKMPSLQDVKDAVATEAQRVIGVIKDTAATETQQVIDKINSIPVGTVITQEDKDAIVASVTGIATAVTGAIDAISEGDSAVPQPPAPPPVP